MTQTARWRLSEESYEKDEFIRYNCSQQIVNVNNTCLLGCCLSWSRIVNTELGKSVALHVAYLPINYECVFGCHQ